MARLCGCLLLGASLTAAGCSTINWKPGGDNADAAKKTAPPPGTHVKVGGDGFALGDVEQSGCAPQPFVDRVAELLRGQRLGAVERWVERFPDVAQTVLREPGAVRTGADVLAAVAAAHDRHCSRGTPDAGWTALFADRAAHAERYKTFDAKRSQFMVHLQNGRVKEALKLGLTEAAPSGPGPLAALDAWRLTGIACLLDNRPADALSAFQQSLALAGREQPYEAAGVLLLTSDAHRRAEDLVSAQRVWQDAARLAAELLGPPTPVIDPILWERLAYLRPVQSPWPGETCHALSDANAVFGIVFDPRTAPASIASTDEAPLWTAIGHWRLARDEAQAALVALKRAESLSSQPYISGRLELSQAKALVKLGQNSAATAILIHLASGSDLLTIHAATAMLGTSRLKQGGVQEGFNLLRQAVQDDGALVWPERTQAEADLGLAYLLMGDEPSGIRWLHEAQQGFEATGQPEALLQCLENEAAYLDHAKKADLAQALRHRIETLRGA